MSVINFTYKDDIPVRLDIAIFNYVSQLNDYSELTRSQIKNLIIAEKVKVDEKVVRKPADKILKNSEISLVLDKTTNYNIEPYELELNILYQDQDLVVIDKPIGLSMHPGAGNRNKTLVNALYFNAILSNDDLKSFNSDRPGIVHRLDRDTSGVVVVAKNLITLQELSTQFSDRTIERKYKALAYVTPRASRVIQQNDSGFIDKPIGRHKTKPTFMQVNGKSPKSAKTHFLVLKKFSYAYLLELKLETGRTHQIRVHLSEIGSPVIGDLAYGSTIHLPKELEKKAKDFGRQALHAYSLEFTHPKTKERMRFESDLPKDFKELVSFFNDYEQI